MADINLGFTNISQAAEQQQNTEKGEVQSTSLGKEEKKDSDETIGSQEAEKEGNKKASCNKKDDESHVKDYNDFKNKATPFAHFKVRRNGKFCTGEYYHHFIVIRISNNVNSDRTDDFTVAHFTSSAEILTENSQGSGKFTCQTISKDHNLLGYGTIETPGLYLVKHPEYPKNEDEISKAWKRLYERLGERDYQLSWNNCEHVVKYILTGKSSCKQVDENRCRADCFNFLIDLREVGLRAALLVSSLGAIAGSLVRRAYVTIIVAAIVSYSVGTLEHVPKCGNKIGANIINEAEARIKVAESRSRIAEQTSKQHLNGTKQYLYNKFVCDLAGQLAEDAVFKTCGASLVVSVAIETIFLYYYVYYSLLPKRRKILCAKEFCRIVFLHVLGGYGSILLSILCGYFGFLNLNRPALVYFLVVFFVGFSFRYLLTIIGGMMFDLCHCQRCLNCYEKCEHCCIPVWYCSGKCGKIGFAIVTIIFLGGIGCALYFFLR
ncbi:uncharacterized protein LOC127698663 [Mytilus californianus]|uniref:uncharacterized protein LOC127698663 n=1 Tax=Mytilus californianus TaxID=6549 RepID=UPI002245AB91|nr:uncharacterized protein LOC127698663 [Mytilus californianus]